MLFVINWIICSVFVEEWSSYRHLKQNIRKTWTKFQHILTFHQDSLRVIIYWNAAVCRAAVYRALADTTVTVKSSVQYCSWFYIFYICLCMHTCTSLKYVWQLLPSAKTWISIDIQVMAEEGSNWHTYLRDVQVCMGRHTRSTIN